MEEGDRARDKKERRGRAVAGVEERSYTSEKFSSPRRVLSSA